MNMKQRKEVALLALTIGMLAVLSFGPSKSDATEHARWTIDWEVDELEVDLYFHWASLNRLHVDGDANNNYRKVKSSVEDSMENYNAVPNADIDLSTTARFQSGDYVVYARNLGIFGNSAEATPPRDPDRRNTNPEYVRFNTARQWGTDGGCRSIFHISYAYNLEWISNHELGHVTGLKHRDPGTNSAMVKSCATSWNNVQETDKTMLQHLYG